MKVHSRKIPTLIAVTTLLVGVVAGIVLIQQQQSVQTSASAENSPHNVTVSNVQSDAFTVSWTTDNPTAGFVLWGSGVSPSNPAQSMGGGSKEVHMVKVTNLDPDTEYSFTITSAGTVFNNSGEVWKVKTGPTLGAPESSRVMSGTIETKDGSHASQSVVIVTAPGMSPLSTLTSSTGSWVIPLSLARTEDLLGYAALGSSKLEISVFSSGQTKASAVANADVNQALPTITLGHAHDFTNLSAIASTDIPKAQLDLPEGETQVQGISDSSLVTLKSVDNGEVIFTNEPEFFGDGPAGSEIKITVHSDPVSGTAQVEQDGQWSWSPAKTLENGLHNITLEWIDTQGIVHTLTRSFIVQAQEGSPSFESTPSATKSPSPSPSPTPTRSPSPSPTATAKPSPTATAKPSNLPDAGIVTPSVLLGAAGFVTLSLGAVLALKNK